jgi:hypothetical protein
MKSPKNERDDFDKATGWLEHTEGLSLEELRELRRAMGHDVESSEKTFLSFLKTVRNSLETSQSGFGILSRARELGLSIVEFANGTELSVALVTKLDRRLIEFASIPREVLKKLSEVLNVSVTEPETYLRQGAAFAVGAEYKADEAPTLPEKQDFFDAVTSDKTLSEQRRKYLLSLRPQ